MQFVGGQTDVHRLQSSVSTDKEEKQQTRNLGELFREAQRRSFKNTKKRKTGKRRFNTGIGFLYLAESKQYKQGFQWRYVYVDENDKKRSISRVNLLELKDEVFKRGLEWNILDKRQVAKTAEKAGVGVNQLLGDK